MSCATKSLFKPLPTANGCLISVPSIFTSKTIYPYLYVPSRHIKHSLSCSYSSSLPSLFSSTKRTRFPCLVSFVSPQKEEDNTVVLEQEELSWGNQETGGTEAPESDWEEETEGEQEEGEEEGFIEAIGDAGESGEEDGFAETDEEGDDYKEPPEEAKLYVGNLAYDIDSEKLAHLFGQAGIVEIAEVIYNRETGQSRGFAFVTMSTVEEAEKAVEIFHRYDVNGRLLIVNKAAPRGSKPERPPRVFEPAYRIYVGNLQWDVDNSRLKQVFSEHGKVTNAQVVCDRETGRSRGFGFVMMSCEAEMNDAIANLDGQSLDGRIIKVSVAEERPRRSNF